MFNRISNALDELLTIQEALEAAHLEDYFGRSTISRGSVPSVNLFQDGEDIVLTAEIPGVKKEDLQLSVKDNLIQISGERKLEYPKHASAHRFERSNQKFDRTIKLPTRVDLDNIRAEYQDGILKIVLPRSESDKPKQIPVN